MHQVSSKLKWLNFGCEIPRDTAQGGTDAIRAMDTASGKVAYA